MAWQTPKPLWPDPNTIITAADLPGGDVFDKRSEAERLARKVRVQLATPKAQEFAEKLTDLCREYGCQLSGDDMDGLVAWLGKEHPKAPTTMVLRSTCRHHGRSSR